MVRLSVKASDAWWTVAIVDPLAAPAVRAVYSLRRVTPNRLSAASLIAALVAAVMFATGELRVAALIFQVSFLLDCMDGKLAHSRAEAGRYGGWIDSVVDSFRAIACYAGLAWALVGDDLSRADVVALAVFPAAAYAVVLTGKAWPDRIGAEPLVLDASALTFLRAVPRRLGRPASTVDAEAVLFTVGPLLGRPVLGLWVALAFNVVHLLAGAAVRGRRALTGSGSGAAHDGGAE